MNPRMLPTHSTHALECMDWLLQKIHEGASIKDLEQMISAQLKRNRRPPTDLRRERFGVPVLPQWKL